MKLRLSRKRSRAMIHPGLEPRLSRREQCLTEDFPSSNRQRRTVPASAGTASLSHKELGLVMDLKHRPPVDVHRTKAKGDGLYFER